MATTPENLRFDPYAGLDMEKIRAKAKELNDIQWERATGSRYKDPDEWPFMSWQWLRKIVPFPVDSSYPKYRGGIPADRGSMNAVDCPSPGVTPWPIYDRFAESPVNSLRRPVDRPEGSPRTLEARKATAGPTPPGRRRLRPGHPTWLSTTESGAALART
jgi:hypothetical protein